MKNITITTEEYISLLETKIAVMKQLKEEDSSWNYGIEELEARAKELKNSLKL